MSVARYRFVAMVCSLSVVGGFMLAAESPQAASNEPIEENRLFASDPTHLWNRLHGALFVRRASDGHVYGEDETDPLLWPTSKALLSGNSSTRARSVLEEFVITHGERQISDAVKRAVLQSDLWAVFDWAAGGDQAMPARLELESLLSRALMQVALPTSEISDLSDNYAEAIASRKYPRDFDPAAPDRPFLPPDLLATNGPWVNIGVVGEVTAPAHTRFTSGRSVFRVLLRLPGGREATMQYLKQLDETPQPWIINSDYPRSPDPVLFNPALPQVPEGTQVALVRQMVLINTSGELQVSPIIQSVQLRVYRHIDQHKLQRDSQAVFEFRMSRELLFAGKHGGLNAVARDQKELATFNALPEDPFESKDKLPLNSVLDRCFACHRDAGIFSINTYTRFLSSRNSRPTLLMDASEKSVRDEVLEWKRKSYDWGLFQGLIRNPR